MTLKERLYRFRSFWMFPAVAVLLFYLTFQPDAPHRYWLLVIGILMWTLIEYALHRFVFHIQIPVRNPRLREIVNSSHLSHHASPRDPEKLLVHPSYGFVISAMLYGIFAMFVDLFSATLMMTGIWIGFLYYEAVHYRVHFSLAGSGLVARQRRKHFHHHFTNNKKWFGVTSPLWDYVFRTTA